MRIVGIDYIKLFVPWKETYRDAMQRWRAMSGTTPLEEDAYVVIRVRTDEGVVGLGEGGRSLAQAQADGLKYIGQNPMALPLFDLRPPFLHAMVDITAKVMGVPACMLLGGKFRERVGVAYWSPYLSPAETARHAEEGVRLGFTTHKIKARPWDAAEQVRQIAAAAGPAYQIRIDPNETFELPAATLQVDDEIRSYNVECLEDPVAKARPAWWALLRQKCHTPLAVHTHDPQLILEMARRDAIDYVNVGGTPNETRAAAAVAAAAGCPVWVQFEGHCLDIAAAFDAHMAAALPNATLPSDILHFLREGPVVQQPLELKDGMLTVPCSPGLGVDLDDRLVDTYRVE